MRKLMIMLMVSMLVLGGMAFAGQVIRPTSSDQPVLVYTPTLQTIDLQVVNTTPRDYKIKIYSDNWSVVCNKQYIGENSVMGRTVVKGKYYLVELYDESGNHKISNKYLGRLDANASVNIPQDFPGLNAQLTVSWYLIDSGGYYTFPSAKVTVRELDDQGQEIPGTSQSDWAQNIPAGFSIQKGGNYRVSVIEADNPNEVVCISGIADGSQTVNNVCANTSSVVVPLTVIPQLLAQPKPGNW